MYYTIERKVFFFPEDKELRTQNHTLIEDTAIILHTPAARCLSTLLENRGSLVTQKMLFEAVWENYNLEPSSNSLYQSISTIRKNLLIMGIDKTVILTRPREGFYIPEDILIEVFSEDEPGLLTDPGDEYINKNNEEKKLSFTNRLPRRNKPNLKIIVAFFLIFIFALFFTQNEEKNKNHFSHFVASERNDKSCFIYYNRDSTDFLKHKNFMDSHHFNCIKYPYIYVEAYAHAPKLSVIRCSEDMKKMTSPMCISEYYADY
ncbi:winged helix-turn-helix domain-containing protein [Enterobacter cancerogenus]|uniref:winged helix-turn-helix domain-containing protein n=1 Tax=Enterobacter cancerogenus TaxID=69218 RepID=UPI000733EACE|nr:winged helix-turn-helix domain-containing protein [Enterobacter cancerogenus]KTQ46840.1 hypothetical protein NS104_14185 [Enterobacter cancerogenus]KTQ49126.1 hypothetical protein NS111_18490 [Enterobacter cancerogenus]KTQ69254.1 hypothetical protein NS188_20320 [Enterobacter cancerogenus]KTQ75975.1 hypothetical protein NS31R_23065 [Enterobacter cancerogenus]